ELSTISGVSSWQISRIEYGLFTKMPIEILLKLAKALQVSPPDLLSKFINPTVKQEENNISLQKYNSLQAEYKNLQAQMAQTREDLLKEFQNQVIEAIESWLIQWPTVIAATKKNPNLTAIKILPLVNPIENLLKQWGLEAIGTVGAEIPYDPTIHQLMSGIVEPGEMVMVRYVGYRQAERLIYRCRVTPVH
ncbi:MAG: helix-turn-helix domain-containing protein, partial [Cyanobacteria bacterium J083]